MVHYPFKHRAKRETVMPAERCGKPEDWDGMLNGTGVGRILWTLNFRVEERQYAAISKAKR